MSGTSGNVTPLKRTLTPPARVLLDRITGAADFLPELDRPYIVKGWLDRGAVSVVYGDSNVGKSFWAVDLAYHVHEGIAWAGCRVRQGNVLYIAAEGGAMFVNRLVARRARFQVLPGQITLAGRNHQAPALAEAVRALIDRDGDYVLIVIDTLARVMGAADENTASDIASLVHAVDLIRGQTGAHLMLVHHTGKNAALGMRGHSSLRAAIDTEIELTKGDEGSDLRLATTKKQRDMPGGREMEFRLHVDVLGTDSDGDQVTSCIIVHETKDKRAT